MPLDELFENPAALPTIPKVVQQLISSFSREDVSVNQIASGLSADPVLCAKTLRLANSAYFHVSRRIGTVDEALQMLGFVMVRNLVLGCGMAGAFKSVPGMDLPQFWRYSLDTACAARWLAQAGGHNADLAFTVGLVHGLGQLLLHMSLPARMKTLDEECHPLAGERAALEKQELGYHHGAVSAEMAQRWKFPAEVAAPLNEVPDLTQLSTTGAAGDTGAVAALVHLAAWRARVQALHLQHDAVAKSCPVHLGPRIGLPLVWREEDCTFTGDHPALVPGMPPLEEMSQGLDTMLQ